MTISYWHVNPNRKKIKCDYLIVGGGISGLSTMHWLNKSCDKSCLILERNSVGHGASGRNAGFLSTGSLSLFAKLISKNGLNKALRMRSFYKRNHELIKSEFNDLLSVSDYSQNGSVSLAFDELEISDYKTLSLILNTAGFEISELSQKDIEKATGSLGAIGGFLDKEDGSLHSIKFLYAVKDKLLKYGRNRIIEHEEIYEVNYDSKSALTKDFEVNFNKIIFTTNGYAPILLPELSNLIFPIRGQMMVLESGDFNMKHNIYASSKNCYLRQIPGGELLIGGFRSLEESSEVGYDDSYTTTAIQGELHRFIENNFPWAANRKVLNQWAGIMGFSFDENPIVGELKPDCYYVGGYHGHGMGKAFACAKALVDHICHGVEIQDFLNIKRAVKNKEEVK